jgi:SAM-dependent methyltransferase
MSEPERLEFAGYDALIAYADRAGVGRIEGDFIEIGAFMGGGTAKLAAYAARFGKRVLAVDIFDPTSDCTADSDGYRMADIYVALLNGRSQREVYDETIRGWPNVETYEVDSMTLVLPPERIFSLGFIDGNHDPAYVRHDFELVWERLVPGGVIAFDDYGGTLPGVRAVVDRLIVEHAQELERADLLEGTRIIALRKAPGVTGRSG